MLLRTLLTFVNLGTIGVAIAILLAYPQYAGSAFYILLGWMFGSLILIYGPWANRPIGGGRAPPASTPGGPAAPRPVRAGELGFCIYCAAPLAAGAPVCPSCGRAVPAF